MAGWNGSGTFSRTHDWTQDQGNGIKIRADRHDDNDVDFVSGINNCMTKDGQNSATADLNMGGKKLKNGATATLVGDFPIVSDVQNSVQTFITSTGSANAYVVTLAPAPAAYVTGQTFTFKANFANTGAATVNVNGLGAKTIKKFADTTDLEANDIVADQIVEITYDGTVFQTTIGTVEGGGSLVLLETQTASTSALIEFTSGIDSTYKQYILDIIGLTVVSAARPRLTLSTNAGSSYLAADYQYASMINQGDDATYTGNVGVSQSSITLQNQNGGETAGENGLTRIVISDPSSASLFTAIRWRSSFLNGTPVIVQTTGVATYVGATTAINAIKIDLTTGNMALGTFKLYGVL